MLPICANPPAPPIPPPNSPNPNPAPNIELFKVAGVNHNNSLSSLFSGISYICWLLTNCIKSFFNTESPPACRPTILE